MAISVRQPWAAAIILGWKPIENRGWARSYRGPLAIHASQRWDDTGVDAIDEVLRLARATGVDVPEMGWEAEEWEAPCWGVGVVLGTVDLVDVCIAARCGGVCQCGPWARPGQAHWRLTNPRPLDHPVPMTGRLGLWNVDLLEGAL